MSRVSYLMMNPDDREGLTDRGARGHREPDRQGLCAKADVPRRRHAGSGVRRQSGDAPPVPGHRSDRARRRAVRAGRVLGAAAVRRATRPDAQPGRAGLHAALHRRPCRRGCRRRWRWPKGRSTRTRSCWSSMSAPTRKSCSATARACWPPVRPPARRSRARRSPPASALRPAPSSACASTRHAGAALPGHRRRSVVRRAGLRRRHRGGRRHRHLRLRHHRGGGRDVPGRRHHREDGVIDGSLAAARRASSPTAAPSPTCCWRRRADPITVTQTDMRAIQLAKAALYAGTKLLMEKQGIEHVDRIQFAGAFGCFIDPKYAMVLGLIPDCDLDKVSAPSATPPAPARAWRCSIAAIAARSRRRSADREDRDRAGTEIPGAFRPRHGAAQQGRPVPETGGGGETAAAQDGQRGRRRRRRRPAPALARRPRGKAQPRIEAIFAGRLASSKFICMQMFPDRPIRKPKRCFAKSIRYMADAFNRHRTAGRKVLGRRASKGDKHVDVRKPRPLSVRPSESP